METVFEQDERQRYVRAKIKEEQFGTKHSVGAQLIDALGVKPVQAMPEKTGLGMVTVRELGIEPTSFCLQPKAHAVLDGFSIAKEP